MSPVAKTRDIHARDASVPVAVPTPSFGARLSRHQLKDQLIADTLAMKRKWKTLIEPAKTLWPKLHSEDLLKVDGDFHRLAGLVQLRYQLDREESDRQVKAFFTDHDALS